MRSRGARARQLGSAPDPIAAVSEIVQRSQRNFSGLPSPKKKTVQDKDHSFLLEMQRATEDAQMSALGETARMLLLLRDQLNFDDSDWYHQLTQHLVTLDSASTFYPADELQERQLKDAIRTATSGILQLICTKIQDLRYGRVLDDGRGD